MLKGKINMEYYAFILCLAFAALLDRCQTEDRPGEKYRQEAIQIINSIFHKYNGRVAPLPHPDPVTLDVHLSLVAVQDLDIAAQCLDTIVDLEIEWVDGRLQWYPLLVPKIEVEYESVWKPEVSILNLLEAPVPVTSPGLVVKSSGNVYWFRRLKLKTYCKTNSSNIEDPVECVISLGSRLHDKSEQDFSSSDKKITFDVTSGYSNHKWEVVGYGIERSTKVIEMPTWKKSDFENATELFNYTELNFQIDLKRTEYYNELEAKALESDNTNAGATVYLTSLILLLPVFIFLYCR